MNKTKIKERKIKSVKKLSWSQRKINDSEVIELTKKYKIDNIYGSILNSRGINAENFEEFINPKLKFLLPDPLIIDQMQKATELITNCIIKKEKIGVIGDYDVDGITSTSLLINYFNEIGVKSAFFIPNRLKDGYGPSAKAFEYLDSQSCELVLTVDCGTNAATEISKVKKKDFNLIVIDHHLQNDRLPDAYAILNPNKKNDNSNLNNLCAAGIVFFVIIALTRELEKRNFFAEKKINLLKFLDLVALATICDVVMLDKTNRVLVKQGLKVINQTKNQGISSLLKLFHSSEVINEYHLGFEIGPRINADGRVGNSSLGVKLLTTDNNNETDALALKLDELNSLRKKVEKEVTMHATGMIGTNKNKIICIHSSKWHPGVIGIVASRITNTFLCPSILISETEPICKGSCRSVQGFNIGKLIYDAVKEGILVSGGGHKMAGGFSIDQKNINLFKNFVNNKFPNNGIEIKKNYECEILLSQLCFELLDNQDSLSPFGQGNPTPKFLIKDCYINFMKVVGDGHLVCTIEDFYGNKFKSISFGAVQNGLFQYVQDFGSSGVDVIVKIKKKVWKDEMFIELQIEDVVLSR